MLPGSLAAALSLLALVPGYWYLRRTDTVRRPSESTALQEAIEIVAVGLLTTGATIGLAILIWGSDYLDILQPEVSDTSDLRKAIGAGFGSFATASLMALIAGWIRVLLTPKRRYAPNVWESVFGETRDGMIRHIAFELDDGRTFDGPLHAYTVVPAADGARQLAIKGPIRVSKVGATTPTSVVYDRIVVDASQIRFASVTYIPAG